MDTISKIINWKMYDNFIHDEKWLVDKNKKINEKVDCTKSK